VHFSFWGLNLGLASMIVFSLFPGGVMQLYDVLQNGYWHARGHEYLSTSAARLVEWARMPGDLIFILVGVAPLPWITVNSYLSIRRQRVVTPGPAVGPLLPESGAAD
jgi:nitric oxide reductase subunit B